MQTWVFRISPQNPCKMLNVLAHAYKLNTGETETGEPLRLSYQLAYLTYVSFRPRRKTVSKDQNRWMVLEEPCQRLTFGLRTLDYTCAHTQMYTNMHTHRSTHKIMEFDVLCAILLKQDNRGVTAQNNNYKISWTWFYVLIINRNKINEVDMGFLCKNFIIGLKFVETTF